MKKFIGIAAIAGIMFGIIGCSPEPPTEPDAPPMQNPNSNLTEMPQNAQQSSEGFTTENGKDGK